MNEDTSARLHEKDLVFFGKMGANITHEMRNVLSIIGENAGLMEDLIAVAGRKGPDCDRLEKVASSIIRNVQKGTEVMQRFSRFAHAADEQVTPFDLTSLTENIAALARKPVTQAGCSLDIEIPNKPIPIMANSFRMQYAIYFSIQLISEISDSEKDKSVRVKLEKQGQVAVVSIIGYAASHGEISNRISSISAIMDEMKGSIQTSFTDGMLSLILSIPIG